MEQRRVVLVVEDEPIARQIALEIVQDAGFDPIEARNADEAIRILQDRSDIRIVFTDIDMPGSMDGLKLARLIRDRWPPIELIVTTGANPVSPQAIPARGTFLRKPYTISQLTNALERWS